MILLSEGILREIGKPWSKSESEPLSERALGAVDAALDAAGATGIPALEPSPEAAPAEAEAPAPAPGVPRIAEVED